MSATNIEVVISLENDKIVVLKKTRLQLYFKTFIEKINSGTWLCSRADIYSM